MTASIVFANRGLAFDGRTLGREPLGGVESALVELAEALVRRGARVQVFNDCVERVVHHGVEWIPRRSGLPLRADLFIANRDHQLLLHVPFARRRVLWLHNPGWKVASWPYRAKLTLLPSRVIVLGEYHRSSCPGWMQGRTVTIPLGLSEAIRSAPERPPPPPRAIFTSNPARNLDWVLHVWAERIHPQVPGAEFHLFSGPEVYGMHAGSGHALMRRILDQAMALREQGVVVHKPVGRDELIGRITAARVMLYRGHEEETFCLALAEAQALGVPCVVQPIGSAAERVRDTMTGFVAADEESFARRGVELLRDDALWISQHRKALQSQRGRGWEDVAADFLRLLEE